MGLNTLDELSQVLNSLRGGFLRKPEYLDPHKRLWIAVIVQALVDIHSRSSVIRQEAIEFLESEELVDICHSVDIDEIRLLKHVRETLTINHKVV